MEANVNKINNYIPILALSLIEAKLPVIIFMTSAEGKKAIIDLCKDLDMQCSVVDTVYKKTKAGEYKGIRINANGYVTSGSEHLGFRKDTYRGIPRYYTK